MLVAKLFDSPDIYRYVMVHDMGFAPNPFHGACTLATCKPTTRRCAQKGDWIVGLGSKRKGLENKIIYAMRVEDEMTFTDYWDDPAFLRKQPDVSGSCKRIYGDNIYHQDAKGNWEQADSRHGLQGASINLEHLEHDTQTDRILIAREKFVYFGENAETIPEDLHHPDTSDWYVGFRGEHKHFPTPQLKERFATWLESLIPTDGANICGYPSDWPDERQPIAL